MDSPTASVWCRKPLSRGKKVICSVDVESSKRDIKRRGFCHHLLQGQRAFTGWGEPAKPSPSVRLMFHWRRCSIHSSCSIFLPFNDVWTWADGAIQLSSSQMWQVLKGEPTVLKKKKKFYSDTNTMKKKFSASRDKSIRIPLFLFFFFFFFFFKAYFLWAF